MKHILAALMIMGTSLAYLWHFSNIIRLGSHLIKEPNIFILVAETVGMIAIFGYGFWYFIKALKGLIKIAGRD